MDFVVYEHRHKLSGKRYIGMTNNVERRWRRGGSEYKSATNFYEAVRTDGWDAFTHEILEHGLTETEARRKEREYIARYNTTDPAFGYNTDKGGHGGAIYKEHPRNMLGKQQTEHQKENQRSLMLDDTFNPMKNGAVVWGETHEHPRGMKGKRHTAEHNKAISEKMKEAAVNGKAVRAYFPDGSTVDYKTTGEAAESIGLSKPIILRLIRSGEAYKAPNNNQYAERIAHLTGLKVERL